MDLSFWSGRFLKINVMSVIRKDFPDIVREILTDVAIASHPSAMTAFLSVKALWDTGATFSVISRDKVAELGLVPVDFSQAYTANGWYETPVYRIDLFLPNGPLIKGLRVSQSDLMVCDMLIGMDVISLGDLPLTNNGKTVFKFAIPPESNKDDQAP